MARTSDVDDGAARRRRSPPRFSIASRPAISKPKRACSAASCSARRLRRRGADRCGPTISTTTPTSKLFAHMRGMHDERQADRHHAAGRAAEDAGRLRADRRRARTWPRCCNRCPPRPTPCTTPRSSRDKATLRSLIHASTEILRDAYDAVGRAARDAQPGRAEDLRHSRRARRRRRSSNISDILHDAMVRIDARMKQRARDRRHRDRLHAISTR